MKFISLFIVLAALQACASKSTGEVDAKKSQPVVSVFDQSSTTATQQTTTETTATAPATTQSSTTAVTEAPQSKQAAATTEATVKKDSPKEVIKRYTAELQAMQVTESAKKNQDKQIAEKVRNFFDFQSLAKYSLGSNWSKLNAKKQAEYVSLFTQLIENSYLQRSKSLVGNYKLSYGNEVVKGDKATVECNIYQNDVDLQLVYELHKASNSWMIYNIIFDQVNLIKNYQTQFNQIIAKSDVDGLIKIMKRKLQDKNSDVDSAL